MPRRTPRWTAALALTALAPLISVQTACAASSPTATPTATVTAKSWWVPAPGSTWQVQYSGALNLNVKASIYNLDGEDTSAATVTKLKARGVRTICYINAGAWEDWRGDRAKFPADVIGDDMDGWDGERWLDIRRTEVLLPLMTARMASCKAKGFDAVDADNVHGYENETGFDLSAADQLRYNKALAAAAHRLGLGFGLKNDLGQIAELASVVDFAVNEECQQYRECGGYAPLVAAKKAVFSIEYAGRAATICARQPKGFSTLIKRLDLGAVRTACIG
jgi:hypothetical protein